MIEIYQVEHRKKERTAQLKSVTEQIQQNETLLLQLRQRQIATQGALSALEEILVNPTIYGKPSTPKLEDVKVGDVNEV